MHSARSNDLEPDRQVRAEHPRPLAGPDRAGVTTVEVRVGYASMRKIQSGQELTFVSGEKRLRTRVIRVTEYDTFETMLDTEDPRSIGGDLGDDREEILSVIRDIYPPNSHEITRREWLLLRKLHQITGDRSWPHSGDHPANAVWVYRPSGVQIPAPPPLTSAFVGVDDFGGRAGVVLRVHCGPGPARNDRGRRYGRRLSYSGITEVKDLVLAEYDRMGTAGVDLDKPLVDGENYTSTLTPPPGHGPRHG